MKKKNKGALISLLIFIPLTGLLASYFFYVSVKKPIEPTTVNTCDEVSIDSIKTYAVRDTIVHYSKIIDSLNETLQEKQETIITQKKTINQLRKDRDSISVRLELSRNRYRELKSKIEPTSE